MPRARPPHLHREQTRHKVFVWYVRREHGPRVRLRADYDTQEFWAEYNAALTGTAPTPKTGKQGTLRWAIARYRMSSAWAGLSNATRKQRENIFQHVEENAGDKPISNITQTSILNGREKRAETPHAANNFLKAMRGLFGWAAGDGKLVKVNPTLGVKLLKGRNDDIGFHTWTEAEVSRFEAFWPVGTRQRLALDILLFTGLRRGDAVRLGRQHIHEGYITIRTEKTGEVIVLPLLSALAKSIDATDTGDLAFLVTLRGQPFVKESFGNWFRKACSDAGCPGSAHGLRKAGAVRAAENGATERQMNAIFGWSSPKMAAHYTRAASQKRLAEDAGQFLTAKRSTNKNARTRRSGTGENVKTPKKSGV